MAIYVTGDLHGGLDIQKLYDWEHAAELSRSDYLIVAGDFGYPWDFLSREEEIEMSWLERQPYTLLFVDGNHERYDHWADRPREEWKGGVVQRLRDRSPIRRLCRGEIFELDGQRIFVMGGAHSVDKAYRTPMIDWWPSEMPNKAQFDHAVETLDSVNWEVDYVITHTCSNRMLPKALYPSAGWEHPDFDALTKFLDMLEDKLTFKHWYFGHMHNDRDCDEKHTLLYNEIVPLGKGVVEAMREGA